jgi:hypothetical protein
MDDMHKVKEFEYECQCGTHLNDCTQCMSVTTNNVSIQVDTASAVEELLRLKQNVCRR